jgi:hypothetical protein
LKYAIDSKDAIRSYSLLPILQTENISIIDLFDNVEVNGKGTYKIENSIYGELINISSSNDYSIEFLSNDYSKFSTIDAYKSIDFSAKDEIQEQYYCYSNYSEIIYIDIEFDYSYQLIPHSSNERPTGTSVEITINGDLHQGWNLLNGTIIGSCA